LDCAVLAVPQQALAQAERPALRPEPGGPTFNVLLTHGVYGGLGEERGTVEYGGAALSRELLAPEKWDYIALGHYHTAQSVATNAWYSGSLEYLPPNPWGQLQDEAAQRTNAKGKKERTGKGYLLVDLPGARRQTLTETVRDFLGRRPLDAELNRETFVKLGVEYLEATAGADGEA